MADEQLILDHVRSANALGQQAAKVGNHAEGWKIYRDSAESVIAAAPGTPAKKKLELALQVAEQEKNVQKRASLMQQAFDKLLSKSLARSKSLAAEAGAARREPNLANGLSCPGTGAALRGCSGGAGSRPGTGQPRRLLPLGPGGEGLRSDYASAPNLANGLSRPADAMSQAERSRPGSRCGVEDPTTDPSVGPAHLRQYLRDISRPHGPEGRSGIYKPASTPYFEHTPHAKEHYFSGAEKEGRVTSHYTKLGAPKSNSHYKNTLAGANTDFEDFDPWKTSNMCFQGNANKYKVAPPERVNRDANFQYVNGDPRQGLAHIHQRAMLPAYHRTQAEINGLGMGGR
eukprot:TRINITY_DN66314_c0_g1_i1.p1 TRINITY_DN66314_c0_g1~~TRINITY_DN66314_c0_g1_i1.p1  ORF type:complete len:351 (-),score=67.07 TRINITY_DN66314_c0_g1_i1:191-1222(-)